MSAFEGIADITANQRNANVSFVRAGPHLPLDALNGSSAYSAFAGAFQNALIGPQVPYLIPHRPDK